MSLLRGNVNAMLTAAAPQPQTNSRASSGNSKSHGSRDNCIKMACDVESLSHKSHGSRDNCIKTACDVESLSHKSDGSRDNCIKTACDVESPSHWIAICSH